MSEQEPIYPQPTRQLADQRRQFAPGPAEAFKARKRSIMRLASICGNRPMHIQLSDGTEMAQHRWLSISGSKG